MKTKKKHKWKYQINIKKKILVLIILGVSLFVSLGYALIESNLDIIGTLMVGQPFITVTFDADGGAVTPSSKNYVKNNYYTDLPTPTKQGYEFLGWNGKNLLNYNDLTNISSGDSGITVDTDGNISDNTPTTDNRGPDYDDNEGWRLDLPQGTYTISLNFSQQSTNNNSELKVENKEYEKFCSDSIANKDNFACTFELSEAQNLNIVVKGYDGIYKVQLEEGNEATSWEPYYITNNTKVIQKDNHTLKAIWKVNEYTVTFNANGGSGGQSANVTATYGSAMPAINTTAPIKTNYTFKGWYDNSDYTAAGAKQYYTEAGESACSYDKASNTTLYAAWQFTPNLGDYIQMTPNPGTLDSQDRYVTNPNVTGTSSVEYIYPKELHLWRVIKVNTDGTIEMVSEYVSSTNVTFGASGTDTIGDTAGVKAYKNYVEYLNILANQYQNPAYTISARHMGYHGQTETISDTSAFDGTNGTTFPWTDDTTSTLNQLPSNEPQGGGDTMYAYDTAIDTGLVQLAYGNQGDASLIAKQCNDTNCSNPTTEKSYWLASRYYGCSSSLSRFYFFVRGVNYSGGNFNIQLRYYGTIIDPSNRWTDSYRSLAIRPIVTLKAGLSPTNASGTKDDPFVLN